MIFSSIFTSLGVPVTGLSPTIRIRDLSTNTLVVTDAAMTEVGDGFYKYDFTTYDATKQYVIRTDGGATLPAGERYGYGNNDNYLPDIEGSTVLAKEATVSAIPTNPLLTNDTRLDNLDATISSRATTTAVGNIPTNPLLANDTRLDALDQRISTAQDPLLRILLMNQQNQLNEVLNETPSI